MKTAKLMVLLSTCTLQNMSHCTCDCTCEREPKHTLFCFPNFSISVNTHSACSSDERDKVSADRQQDKDDVEVDDDGWPPGKWKCFLEKH